MNTIKELFEHELEDMYYAEHKLVTALGEMASESSDSSIKDAFSTHKMETEGHIKRLDGVFAELGMQPKGVTCQGIEGLIKEKAEFGKERPNPKLLDVYNLGAGAKSERYEISSYEGLIGMAAELGLTESQTLLSANLKEEEHALSTVRQLAKTVMR